MRKMEKHKDKNWLYQKYWIEKLNTCEMAKFCNVSPKKIRIWMERFNIKRRNKKEVAILGKFIYRKGETIEEKYGIKRTKEIKEKLRLYNSKYKFNKKAFDILNPQVAYWLGFIYADGYLNEKNHYLRILILEKDKIILDEFKKFLNASHPILYLNNYSNPAISLCVFSKYLTNRLIKLGIYSNKTKTISFPCFLPENLYSDFIRGYFDGDGSIYIRKIDKQWRFAIQSNSSFLINLQQILIKNCNLKKTKLYFKKGTTSALMRYGGNKQIERIISYLIQNKGFFLPRKLGKFMEA